MAKQMLADVLWEAANKWLHPTESLGWSFETSGRLCTYSCHAVQAAIEGRAPKFCHVLPDAVQDFLDSLGCGPALKMQKWGQGARYMWLLLAMHVAEDEGIEL